MNTGPSIAGITAEAFSDLLNCLSLLPFFPADEGARKELLKDVTRYATNDDQVRWLGQRAIQLYTDWPGARELRALFCSRFKPRDGWEVTSGQFAEGIIPPDPSLPPAHAIAPPAKQLRKPAALTDDAGMQALIAQLAGTQAAKAEALRHPPALSSEIRDGRAVYVNFTCHNCQTDRRAIGVPTDAARFACPYGCGAVYEQWRSVTGSYRAELATVPIRVKTP